MKKVTLLFACLIMLATLNFVNAQSTDNSMAYNNSTTVTDVYSSNDSDPEKVEIMTNFKATKQQKKAIKKIKKYVTPRILGRVTHTDALQGKTVKVQVNFSANGSILAISIIEGMGEKIDAKVADLITAFDQKQSIVSTTGNNAPIQMDIPLVNKQYFVR